MHINSVKLLLALSIYFIKIVDGIQTKSEINERLRSILYRFEIFGPPPPPQ